MKQQVFLSSVQNEFALEREALRLHLLQDPLLRLYFEPVLFEKLPADGQQPQALYLQEVALADVFLILIGADYGFETATGVSATETEYQLAQDQSIFSLAFIKEGTEKSRHPKEQELFLKIQNRLSYKRFATTEELLREVSTALVQVLQQKGLLVKDDFDSSLAPMATLADIDEEKVNHFISISRYKRGFPLREGSALPKVLSHLNFMFEQQLTNSAILAFGRQPQRYFPSAVVKCAHFHGTQVEKPIPDHRVIKGDVFTQVDEAVDFILSKITVSVGTRAVSNSVPLTYEIPRPVVAEALVNAIAHRDYHSMGSVQVWLFSDRVTISNPGGLPMELTLDQLRKDHGSYPKNPHLAEALYQAGYIERFGTGTGEILRLCAETGLAEPIFDLEEGFSVTLWRPNTVSMTVPATDQVSELIQRMVLISDEAYSRQEYMTLLQLKHTPNFRENYLNPALEEGYLEMTLPDTPKSGNQKYRLTAKGVALKQRLETVKN